VKSVPNSCIVFGCHAVAVSVANKNELARLETDPGVIWTTETGRLEEGVRQSKTVRGTGRGRRAARGTASPRSSSALRKLGARSRSATKSRRVEPVHWADVQSDPSFRHFAGRGSGKLPPGMPRLRS
jgi:hypothetical protein